MLAAKAYMSKLSGNPAAPLYMSCHIFMQVIATSRGDYLQLAQALGVQFFQDADDFAEEHPEVVILASSILSTEAVLNSLPVQRLKRSTLFVDVLSVKEFPKRLFLSQLPSQVDLLCRFCCESEACTAARVSLARCYQVDCL